MSKISTWVGCRSITLAVTIKRQSYFLPDRTAHPTQRLSVNEFENVMVCHLLGQYPLQEE